MKERASAPCEGSEFVLETRGIAGRTLDEDVRCLQRTRGTHEGFGCTSARRYGIPKRKMHPTSSAPCPGAGVTGELVPSLFEGCALGFLDGTRARGSVVEVEAVMLRSGGAVDVVCGARYQDALDRICGGKTVGGHERACVAGLVIEPENPQDPHAVAVYVETLLVGYLSCADALAYESVLTHLALKRCAGACNALIIGGWDRGDGDVGHYGVRLDLAAPNVADGVGSPPVWPPPVWPPRAEMPRPASSGPLVAASPIVPPQPVVSPIRPTLVPEAFPAPRDPIVLLGFVEGKHHTRWIKTVKDLKRLGEWTAAGRLLQRLCEAAEEESNTDLTPLSPWYFKQLADIERRLNNVDAELMVLERYTRSPRVVPGEFAERITKLRGRG